MLKGDSGAYNISSTDNVFSIKQIADACCKFNGNIFTEYKIEDKEYLKTRSPMMIGINKKLKELGWMDRIRWNRRRDCTDDHVGKRRDLTRVEEGYMERNIFLLDCTLRDGGLALEGAKDRAVGYSEETRRHISQILTDSSVDIIELGILDMGENDASEFSIFHNIFQVSDLIPEKADEDRMYAVFFRGPDIPITQLPDWNEKLCRLIRMGVRYSEMDKSLKYCEKLCEKGYLVSIQPIVTMRYTNEELNKIIEAANAMNAYAVYFVDSYGAMYTADVLRIFEKYDKGLQKNIKVGFHAHNNMGLAASNVINLLSAKSERDIIIDACCMGMGQGAGKLQTEVIVPYLNKMYKKTYDLAEVLKVCDHLSEFWKDNLWGYSVAAMIPDDMKYRYTENNVRELLKRAENE